MPQLTDPSAIRALLETDRAWSIYPLGDLSPEQFPHCAWFRDAAEGSALALLYRGFTPPVFFTLGPTSAVPAFLDEIGDLPSMYVHVRPEVVPLLDVRYQVPNPSAMWRMVLDPSQFRSAETPGVIRLGPPDLDALQRLYADGESSCEQPGFFSPTMLRVGVYFGVREGSELVAAAGTHLVVPAEGVAAIGNVYVRRDRRGRGLAGQVTGAVAGDLLGQGLRTVALNVGQANTAAARVYERLGFVRYCPFTEGLAVRRSP